MQSIAVTVVGAIAVAVLVLVTVPKLFGRTARLKRRLRAASPRAIRDLDVSMPCRVAGMVSAVDEPLIAPLSGRPCVYYETRVFRLVGMDPSALSHKYRVAAETRSVRFLVDDGTGAALVDPTHLEALLETDVDRWSGDRDGDESAEDSFLARFGQRRRGLLFAKRLHFTESIIEIGERIAVLGNSAIETVSHADDLGPYRNASKSAQPHIAGSAHAPIVITDDRAFTPPLDDN